MFRSRLVGLVLVMGCGTPPMSSEGSATSTTGTDGPPPTGTGTTVGMTSVVVTGTSTITTAGSSTGTTGQPDSSGEGSFLIDPDTPVMCLSLCDTWAQDCPAGEKCSAWSCDGGDDWDSTRCSTVVEDPGQPGDPCSVEGGVASGLDDCDLNVMCWNVDPDTGEGTCVALCTGSEDAPLCEDPEMRCLVTNGGVLNLCLPPCDPLLGDCPAGQACVAEDTDFVCTTTVSGIDAAAGEPCEYFYDCQPGLSCQPSTDVGAACDPGEPYCCTPYCDLMAPDPEAPCLDPGQQCTPWGGLVPPLDNVGLCRSPA